jgi:hypothetical protein
VLVHPPSSRPKVTRLHISALCVLLAVTPIFSAFFFSAP